MRTFSIVNALVSIVGLLALIAFGVFLLTLVKGKAARIGAAGIGLMVLGRLVGALFPYFADAAGAYEGGFPYSWYAATNVINLLINIGGIGLLVTGIAVAVKEQQAVRGRYGTGSTAPESPVIPPSAPSPDTPWGQAPRQD